MSFLNHFIFFAIDAVKCVPTIWHYLQIFGKYALVVKVIIELMYAFHSFPCIFLRVIKNGFVNCCNVDTYTVSLRPNAPGPLVYKGGYDA